MSAVSLESRQHATGPKLWQEQWGAMVDFKQEQQGQKIPLNCCVGWWGCIGMFAEPSHTPGLQIRKSWSKEAVWLTSGYTLIRGRGGQTLRGSQIPLALQPSEGQTDPHSPSIQE